MPAEWTADVLKEYMDMQFGLLNARLDIIATDISRTRDSQHHKLDVDDYRREHRDVVEKIGELRARVDLQEGRADAAKDNTARYVSFAATLAALGSLIFSIVQRVH